MAYSSTNPTKSYQTPRDISEGSKRILFGTDNPFFPPIQDFPSTTGEVTGQWTSVMENVSAIENAERWSEREKVGVRGNNALSLFGLL
jgi:predicted TIM-barrel fold metal-dependent hydrolase